MKEKTFLMACLDFFGCKEGQSKMEFSQELKKLTEGDRAEISAGLEMNGYKIVTQPAPQA